MWLDFGFIFWDIWLYFSIYFWAWCVSEWTSCVDSYCFLFCSFRFGRASESDRLFSIFLYCPTLYISAYADYLIYSALEFPPRRRSTRSLTEQNVAYRSRVPLLHEAFVALCLGPVNIWRQIYIYIYTVLLYALYAPCATTVLPFCVARAENENWH